MSTRNLLQVGKAKYDGPKSHRAIIRQIHKDCKQGMSCDFIDKVVGLFFGFTGIQKYMQRGENFRIPGLGTFMITKRGKKILTAQDIKQAELTRLSHNRKVYKYRHKKEDPIAFEEVNKNRKEIGMKPLTFDTFMLISGRSLLSCTTMKSVIC